MHTCYSNTYLILAFSLMMGLVGCHSFQQRMAWSKLALDANRSKNNFLKPEEIDSFFEASNTNAHPYLTSDFQKKLDRETQSELSSNNVIDLLPNKHSLQKKLQLIRNAKHSIYITTFHIICDEGGKEFAKELMQAALKGIDVRFLTTGGPWEWWYSGDCPQKMSLSQVKVANTPYSLITNKGAVNLHDKILVVDAKQAIVGGQNIGSWFFEANGRDRKFRDTDVLVEGPVVNTIAKRFIALWRTAHANDAAIDAYAAMVEKNEQEAEKQKWRGEKNYEQWLKSDSPSGLCRFVSQDPHQNTYHVFNAYQLYAKEAKRRVAFQTPQLNTSGHERQQKLWNTLAQVANKKNGRVFMLTNGPGFVDSEMTPYGTGTLVAYYLLNGLYNSTFGDNRINMFAYRSWMHSKVYYFDGLAVGIGSFNLDESGTTWTENTLICIDPSLIKQTTEMFKNDLAYSIRLEQPMPKG